MKKKPFFSIIIPTFNQSVFLKKNLKSIFLQSYKNFEVIVVDNYSLDNTKNVIKQYQNKIRYFKIKNNGVIGKSRNYGFKKARGKWVSFLDSDDYWTTNKLKIIFDLIKNKNFDVICNNEWQIINNIKKRVSIYGPYKKENFYKNLLLNGNCLSTSASFIKKDFLKKNKILFKEYKSYITAEDYDFFLRIAYCNGVFFFLKKALGYHTYHINSASYHSKRHYNSIYAVIKNHVLYFQKFEKRKKKLLQILKIQNDIKLSISLFANKQSSFLFFIKYIIKNFILYPKITLIFLFRFFLNLIKIRYFLN